MAPKKQQRARKRAGRRQAAPAMPRAIRRAALTNEEKLMRLITDPCEAEMAHGYALSSEGIVQRFTEYYTPAVTTETSFAYAITPTIYGNNAVKFLKGTGTGVIGAPSNTPLPGNTFIDANADMVSTLACCVEVLYTGKLTDRKGYIAVGQGPTNGVNAAVATTTNTFGQLVALSNAVAPIPSSTVSVKWTPTVSAFNGAAGAVDFSDNTAGTNSIIVSAIGVNPLDFVIRITIVYEYSPAVATGMPLSRATRVTPPAIGERITSSLDRMGVWWHNLGNAAAAASRMGNRMVYGAGQVAGFTRGLIRTGEAATSLLALVG